MHELTKPARFKGGYAPPSQELIRCWTDLRGVRE